MSATKLVRPIGGLVRPSRVVIAASACVGLASLALAADVSNESSAVRGLLKARLPKTAVSGVNCTKIRGLCEVTAGSNLFYVDGSARYLIIGRVYDMETRQDITAARLLEMNPDMLVGAAASANAAATSGEVQKAAAGAARADNVVPDSPRILPLAELPKEGAIVWGHSAAPSVTVFSDFRCSYCRALSSVLRAMNVRVIERPISSLGSRDLSDRVYCAKNREEALHAAYAGEPIKAGPACDTSGLDANEAFARKHGLNGTPVIVRSDGAVLEGYRPRPFLEKWLKEGRS
ncbi:DsbC family protein [Sphingobium sp. EP60837]|uniref:DsbC family protein n=1 Tax=Sphingobium sp. EP60837 TaxID=1855519 RepID=UPI0007DDC5D9|nr:DsbC family protein [Sphingobium sp. EP60837]ANI80271.1 Protein disulfide-isomerase [Sphingobium sp. EP60837]